MDVPFGTQLAMFVCVMVLLICQAGTQWRRPRYDLPRIHRRRKQ